MTGRRHRGAPDGHSDDGHGDGERCGPDGAIDGDYDHPDGRDDDGYDHP